MGVLIKINKNQKVLLYQTHKKYIGCVILRKISILLKCSKTLSFAYLDIN